VKENPLRFILIKRKPNREIATNGMKVKNEDRNGADDCPLTMNSREIRIKGVGKKNKSRAAIPVAKGALRSPANVILFKTTERGITNQVRYASHASGPSMTDVQIIKAKAMSKDFDRWARSIVTTIAMAGSANERINANEGA